MPSRTSKASSKSSARNIPAKPALKPSKRSTAAPSRPNRSKSAMTPKQALSAPKSQAPSSSSAPTSTNCSSSTKTAPTQSTNIPEKQYVQKVAWAAIADKKTVMSVVYKNKETDQAWAKRFIVDKFILDKTYTFLDEKSELQFFSAHPEPTIELQFVPVPRQKLKKLIVPLKDIPIKGAQARGVRLALQKVKKMFPLGS